MNLPDLIYYFAFYSFVGWLIEIVYSSIKEKALFNRGFINGPFCIIYGFGALGVIVFSRIPGVGPAGVFLFGLIGLTTLEYITGLAMEKMFGARWWSYEGYFLNIGGRITIVMSLVWGLSSLVLVYVVHPYVVQFFKALHISGFVAVLLGIYFVLDIAMSLRAAFRLNRHIAGIGPGNEIKDIIRKLPFNERRMAGAFPEFISEMIERWSESKKKSRRDMN